MAPAYKIRLQQHNQHTLAAPRGNGPTPRVMRDITRSAEVQGSTLGQLSGPAQSSLGHPNGAGWGTRTRDGLSCGFSPTTLLSPLDSSARSPPIRTRHHSCHRHHARDDASLQTLRPPSRPLAHVLFSLHRPLSPLTPLPPPPPPPPPRSVESIADRPFAQAVDFYTPVQVVSSTAVFHGFWWFFCLQVWATSDHFTAFF